VREERCKIPQMRLWLAFFAVLCACSKAEAPAPSSTTSEPKGAPTTELPKKEEPDQLGAVALPELRTCVKECVGQKGISPKADQDCKNECYDSCVGQCDRQASERPLEFKKRCREDCDLQRNKL